MSSIINIVIIMNIYVTIINIYYYQSHLYIGRRHHQQSYEPREEKGSVAAWLRYIIFRLTSISLGRILVFC